MSLFSSSGMSLSSSLISSSSTPTQVSSSSSAQGRRLSQPLREILNLSLNQGLPFGLGGGGDYRGGGDYPGKNSTETVLESIWEEGEGGEGGGGRGGTRGGGAGEGRERRICMELLGAGWEVVVLQVSVVK